MISDVFFPLALKVFLYPRKHRPKLPHRNLAANLAQTKRERTLRVRSLV
jgi:hypothetical protein